MKKRSSILSVGDCFARDLSVLNRAQCYLLSKFDNVLNFAFPEYDFIFSIVTSQLGASPYHLVFSNEIHLSEKLFFEIYDEINLIDQEKIWNSKFLDRGLNLKMACANVGQLENFILSKASKKSLAFVIDSKRESDFLGGYEKLMMDRIKQAIFFIKKRDEDSLYNAVLLLRGLGIGLTPSGDDFIAGFIWGLHLQNKNKMKRIINQLSILAKGTNLLVNHFLKTSVDALVGENLLVIFQTLEKGVFSLDCPCFNWGETSGFDFATGLLFGIKWDSCD